MLVPCRKQPRDLIRALLGVEFEMRHPDICCGAAGLYSTPKPAMSAGAFTRRPTAS